MGEDALHIAVVGAGISGVALAAMICRELGARVAVTVFERQMENADQGYGLDLDKDGQMALARAGAFHRLWEISQDRSDHYGIFPVRGEKPMMRFFRPGLLQWLFPSYFGAQPESNRAGLRQVMMDAMNASASPNAMRYGEGVATLEKKVGADGWERAELKSADGASKGSFDLVIDASGVSSGLRHYRLTDKARPHYDGYVFFHGAVADPAAVFSPELLRRLGTQGTTFIIAQGYRMAFQRFGAGPDDKRLCWFYFVEYPTENPETFFTEQIGIEPPRSRTSGSIRQDDPRRAKVNDWLIRDLGTHFDPVWAEAIHKLDYLSVRPAFTHQDELQLLDEVDVEVPIVLCGDSFLHLGLGGGGNAALRDAMDIADVLVARWDAVEKARHERSAKNIREALGLDLVKAESTILERKRELRKGMREFTRGKLTKRPAGNVDPYIDLFDVWPRFGIRWVLPALAWAFELWYKYENWKYCGVGSTPYSPIYTCIRRKVSS